MFLKKLYRIAKPIITSNKFLKKMVFIIGQSLNIMPKVLTLTLTYRCQCRCVHCGVSEYKKEKEQEFTTEEVKALIDQAKNIRSIVQITFTGGESLLRDDLVELINYSKSSGFYTKIDTNAALLDRDRMIKLKDAGLDRLGMSLDHYSEEVHDSFRKHKGLFKKVVDAVQLCHDFNISCYIQTYVTRQNLENGDLNKTLDFAENLNVEKIKVQTPAMLGSLKDNDAVTLRHEDFATLEEVILRHKNAYVESEVFSPTEYKKFCRMNFKTNIHITSYGDVLPCCWFPVSFGNIRKNSLKEVLGFMYSSQEFKKLLKCDGCLCSNKKVLDSYFKDTAEYPFQIRDNRS